MKKKFPLGAILSVIGDRLMCDIGLVTELLNYMTGDNLFTHQLPRAAKECQPILLKQHPQLEVWQTEQDKVTPQNCLSILSECELRWGKELDVEKLSAVEGHIFKDAISEAYDLLGKNNVVTVSPGE